MKFESMGEIFADGRLINLDNASVDVLDSTLEKVKIQKDNTLDNINKILAEIQK